MHTPCAGGWRGQAAVAVLAAAAALGTARAGPPGPTGAAGGAEVSVGIEAGDLRGTGGIYNTAPPRTNVCKAPGEWQTYDVVFRAPRFDASGKKTANARFVKLVFNGTVI
jgi:hypothetical protein